MAESNHDDVADALARLAGGDVAPREPLPPAPPPPPKPTPKPAVKAVRPASTRPVAPNLSSPSAPAPKATQPPRPPAPAPVPPAPPAAPRPARSAAPVIGNAPAESPAAPVIRAAAPVVRKPRPAAPVLAPVKPIEPPATDDNTGVFDQADSTTIIDDDDAVIVPAPDASVFQHHPKNTAGARAKKAARTSLALRQTLIPILLTCSLVLFASASMRMFVGPDSTLANPPIWMTACLAGGGVVLLAFAVLNVISVKKQMDAIKK